MLPILGLALLLLISPCKVRNFIQSGLDLTQTQVLNKSQSTVSQSSCQSFEILASDKAPSQKDINSIKTLPSESFFNDLPDLHFCKDSKITRSSDYELVSDIPLYILYKNLKVHA